MHAYFRASKATTVEDVERFLNWKFMGAYNRCDPVEDAFQKEFESRDIKETGEIGSKRATRDFLWIDTQVITFELAEAVRAVVKIIGYGDYIVEFLTDNIGAVVWIEID